MGGGAEGRGRAGPGREVRAVNAASPGWGYRCSRGRRERRDRLSLRHYAELCYGSVSPLGTSLCQTLSTPLPGPGHGGRAPRSVDGAMAKHHPDLIFCRKQAGVGEYRRGLSPTHLDGGVGRPFGAVRARARSFPLFPRPSELGVRGASRGHAVRSPAQGWGFGCAGSAVRRSVRVSFRPVGAVGRTPCAGTLCRVGVP